MEYDDKSVAFFRFEDLRVYHKALDYSKWVLQATSNFSPSYQTLRDQMQRTAVSITSNIAEGTARNKSQFVYYLKLSKTSIRECLVYTSCATGLGLMNEEMQTASRSQLMELTKMLGALIGSIQRTMGNSLDEEEVDDEIHSVQ